VILWDVSTGQMVHRYTEHSTIVWQVAFSPDNQSFLSASNNMILWRNAPITLAEVRDWIEANRQFSSSR
jgi:WD40 repeat protein